MGWALLRILRTKICGRQQYHEYSQEFSPAKTWLGFISAVVAYPVGLLLRPYTHAWYQRICVHVARQPFSLPRHMWDKTVVGSWRVATIDHQTEIFQYVTHSSPPHSDRDHCILRAWHRDVPTGRYVVVSTSVSHPQAELRAGVRVVHLASHFLLQPEEHGTQVTAVCREDWR